MFDPQRDDLSPLKPGNAVAAIILVDGRYLLQLRDNIPGIFFPASWGCFGGGVDGDETPEQAMGRELREELDVNLSGDSFSYFTRFDFDLSFAKIKSAWRVFYEVRLSIEKYSALRLGEGAAMRLFSADEILTGERQLAPYDSFALWFHINQGRLRA